MSKCAVILSRTSNSSAWSLRNVINVDPSGNQVQSENDALRKASSYVTSWLQDEASFFKIELRNRNDIFDQYDGSFKG